MEIKKNEYSAYVKEVTPVNNLWMDMGKAFLIGGLICLAGQIVTNWLTDGAGKGGRVGLDLHHLDRGQHPGYRVQLVSQFSEVWRSWGISADHRVRQFCGGAGDRV